MNSPYRAQPATADEVAEQLDLLHLSAAGRRGADAPRCDAGAHGHGSGGDGGPGGDAGPAQPGEGGGAIHVTLSAGREGEVRVSGSVGAARGRPRAVAHSLELGSSGDVVLSARGGDGGHGGRGGDGGNGARGADGSDATRYSSGSSGGRGGDGGDGGRGSDGARGGDGGEVVVSVGALDTHLLMLVRSDVDGGAGGAAGRHGDGGAGGAGGRGGSSYSWTETESWSDGQGNRQTRTRHHSNPGGSSGSTGSDGRTPRGGLSAGEAGADGRFSIRVLGEGDRATSYASRYDLALVGLRHESDNQDGVHEPEERITVSAIRVENRGGMPTPPNHPITISLREGSWAVPEERELTLATSLAAGQTLTLEQPLTFIIRRPELIVPGDALLSEGQIELAAHMPAVRRAFESFAASCPAEDTRFAVQYPLQLDPIGCLYSMAPGEACRVELDVRNISRKAFGERGEVARVIAWELRLDESEVGADQVRFEHEGARGSSLESGLRARIARIDAGGAAHEVGTLVLAEGAPAYEAVRLRVTLELGRIRDPETPAPIQLRQFVVRVAQRYRADPATDVLFVVHNRTTREELEAWRSAAAALGLRLAVWDVSLEGHLDLEGDREGGALSKQLAGKTLVVLDDPFDTPRGERRAYGLCDPDAILAHVSSGGGVVTLGQRQLSDADVLVPCERRREPQTLRGTEGDSLERALQSGEPFAVSFERRRFFGAPAERELEQEAERLRRALERARPGERYVLTSRFDGSLARAGLRSVFALGEVSVERTADVDARRVQQIRAAPERLRDPLEVGATLAPLALARALPRARRLVALRDATLGQRALDEQAEGAPVSPAAWLARSLAHDASLEIVRAHEATCLPESDALAFPQLAGLTALAELEGQPLDPASALAGALVEVLAAARATASCLVRWWMYLPPLFLFFLLFGRAAQVRRRALALSRGVTEACFAEADRAAVEARVTGVRERLRRAAAPSFLGPHARSLYAVVAAPLEDAGLHTLDEARTVTLTGDERRTLDDARSQQARRRARLVKAMARARAEHIVGAAEREPAPASSDDLEAPLDAEHAHA